jgi:hypothetical protein
MTFVQRRLFSPFVGIVLVVTMVQVLVTGGVTQAHSRTSVHAVLPNCSPCYYFYGSTHDWMYTATNDWYQHQGNWYGIANVRAIQVYVYVTTAKYLTSNDSCPAVAAGGASSRDYKRSDLSSFS